MTKEFSLSTSENLAAKRYVAAGDRAYVVGTADGAFPPMGWHIKGQMGGVWAHPIKLLNGYWFRLGNSWLRQANTFTTGTGYIEISFRPEDDLAVKRTEFSPDGIPAVVLKLCITNATRSQRTVAFQMVARSELMAAYPWSSSQPMNAGEFNGHDRGEYDAHTGTLSFREPGKPWQAFVKSTGTPVSGRTGDDIWGPVAAEDQSTFSLHGAGTGGELTWELEVPAEGTSTLWIAIAGSHTSQSDASAALHEALTDPEGHLGDKVAGRLRLLDQTRISLPDDDLESAFQWGKLNMADLRRTVTDVQVRDTALGTTYSQPLRTIARLTGIGAGFPDYPWFFGTDGAYTVYALICSGQVDTAMEHLRAMRLFSEAVNGGTGKVVHEVASDGSVFFGANADPGDTNETAQFAVAVELLWKWTGDDAFRDEMYDFVKMGLRYITSAALDPDQEGWPGGFGMVERSGMGSRTLDVASYTWLALNSLQAMASAKGDLTTNDWAARKSARLSSQFERDWWIQKKSLYADSLCGLGDVERGAAGCTSPGQKVQQRYWIDAVPMEVGLASADHAVRSLRKMESSTFTGRYGLYHAGRNGGADGRGELAIWTLPNSVMAAAEVNYGRPDQALRYINAIATLIRLEMPGALPEIAPSPEYAPFQSLLTRAMFMQAWSSYGIQWPVIHGFLGIDPDIPAGRLGVVPSLPRTWPALQVENLQVGSSTLSVSAQQSDKAFTTSVEGGEGLRLTIGHTLPPDASIQSVKLNGGEVSYEAITAVSGITVVLETDTDGSRKLEIRVA